VTGGRRAATPLVLPRRHPVGGVIALRIALSIPEGIPEGIVVLRLLSVTFRSIAEAPCPLARGRHGRVIVMVFHRPSPIERAALWTADRFLVGGACLVLTWQPRRQTGVFFLAHGLPGTRLTAAIRAGRMADEARSQKALRPRPSVDYAGREPSSRSRA